EVRAHADDHGTVGLVEGHAIGRDLAVVDPHGRVLVEPDRGEDGGVAGGHGGLAGVGRGGVGDVAAEGRGRGVEVGGEGGGLAVRGDVGRLAGAGGAAHEGDHAAVRGPRLIRRTTWLYRRASFSGSLTPFASCWARSFVRRRTRPLLVFRFAQRFRPGPS